MAYGAFCAAGGMGVGAGAALLGYGQWVKAVGRVAGWKLSCLPMLRLLGR